MNWQTFIEQQKQLPYYIQLQKTLQQEQKEHVIFPHKHQIYNALEHTPFDKTKVVIIGQDPYHQPNQAMGLSFSVQQDTPLPKSLINIFKELYDDLNISNQSGSLINWAKQGVLLLNTTLTVRQDQPMSHKGLGWETFTTNAIQTLCQNTNQLVFILWGKHAQQFEKIAVQYGHFVIKSSHPSPLSAYRGFFGSKPFSQTNQLLKNINKQPIDWSTE